MKILMQMFNPINQKSMKTIFKIKKVVINLKEPILSVPQ